jgi:hypothetical protein
MVYVNPKQKAFLLSKAKTRLMLAGRGSGKTRGGIGYGSAMRVQMLPQSKTFLAGPNFGHILNNLMGEITEAWRTLGWERDKHFVLWRRPPKNWTQPFKAPEKYEYTASFRNGSCINLLSMARPDLIRGLSLDGGDWDEFALAEKENWTDIVLPTLRGNIDKFGHHYLHRNVNFLTSIPRTSRGYHVYEIEEKFKEEVKRRGENNTIDYYFLEANARDNILFWGEDGIERLRRDMGHLRFSVEVMNERLSKAERAFYHKYNPDTKTGHAYVAEYDYAFDDENWKLQGTKDVVKDEILEVSFDFGHFNSCTVWQERNGVEYCVKEFFKEGNNTLSDLVKEFCKYFENHKCKVVQVWGEPRGHNPKDNAVTSYETIANTFNKLGWSINIGVTAGYRTEFHAERYDFINEIFSEYREDLPKIRISKEGAPYLDLTLQTTEVKKDKEKDKSLELKKEFPQEKATHLTDTFDYYIMQKYGWIQKMGESAHSGEYSIL